MGPVGMQLRAAPCTKAVSSTRPVGAPPAGAAGVVPAKGLLGGSAVTCAPAIPTPSARRVTKAVTDAQAWHGPAGGRQPRSARTSLNSTVKIEGAGPLGSPSPSIWGGLAGSISLQNRTGSAGFRL